MLDRHNGEARTKTMETPNMRHETELWEINANTLEWKYFLFRFMFRFVFFIRYIDKITRARREQEKKKKTLYENGEGVSNWSISRLIATCAKFTCCTVIYASKCFCDVFSLEATTKDNFNTKILSLKPFLFIYLCAKHHNVTK